MLLFFAGVLAGVFQPLRAGPESTDVYLLSSFRGTGDGLHFSYSTDALHWTELDRVYFTSRVGGKLFRDPFILKCRDSLFRMVWTSGWKDRGIGFAQSSDLITWSEPRFIPLLETYPVKNCWAPKLMQDEKSGLYRITWASDVEGWFAETPSVSGFNNRTYQVTTRDFINFGKPALMIEPGFDHVDANIVPWRGRYIAVFKQGDDVKTKSWGSHYAATAINVEGPYQLISSPILKDQRADVVAVVIVGDQLIYYLNRHSPRQLFAYSTSDGEKWTDISEKISRAPAPSQGCIFTVSTALFTQLKATSATPASSQ